MIHDQKSNNRFNLKTLRTFKVNFFAELAFFIILLLYALFGLTYKLKQLDYFMMASWFYYFLLSFRNEAFRYKGITDGVNHL